MIDRIILLTGGFDPIHSGHISLINDAKRLDGHLVIGVNSDEWLKRKKNYFFMPLNERIEVLQNINGVYKVISFNDDDDTAINAITKCLDMAREVIFANGGDRNKDNVPELDFFKNEIRVEHIFGVGGINKLNSSSVILSNFVNNYLSSIEEKNDKNFKGLVSSAWGHQRNIFHEEKIKVKKLIVNQSSSLSLQKHKHREEHWIIHKGTAEIRLEKQDFILKEGDYINIPKGLTHRLSNPSKSEKLEVLEIQYGDILLEEDIVRIKDNYGRS